MFRFNKEEKFHSDDLNIKNVFFIMFFNIFHHLPHQQDQQMFRKS